MAIRKEGGRHPRRGRRGELLSHGGECSVEVGAGLLASVLRRLGWKERGSRWVTTVYTLGTLRTWKTAGLQWTGPPEARLGGPEAHHGMY